MIRYLIFILLVFLVVYGLVEAWPLLRGPTLSIISPQENAVVTDGIVTVTGRVTHAASFTLNGGTLLHDQKGYFSSTLTFPRGGTILTFVAADRFGRTIRETRAIFVP